MLYRLFLNEIQSRTKMERPFFYVNFETSHFNSARTFLLHFILYPMIFSAGTGKYRLLGANPLSEAALEEQRKLQSKVLEA